MREEPCLSAKGFESDGVMDSGVEGLLAVFTRGLVLDKLVADGL